MATAPADIQEAGDVNDNIAIDYEAEARKLGWRPAEEFKGNPDQHVDAETFYKRGQEVMPLLKAENKHLKQRIDQLEKNVARASDFFSKAEERAYQRALTDLKSDAAKAAQSGDADAFDRVMDAVAKLEKPGPAQPEIDTDARMEEFTDWSKANRWYAGNDVMRMYADAQAEKIAKTKGGGFLEMADLQAVADAVKAKFEDVYPDEFEAPAPRAKPRSPVDGGGTAPRQRGGRSFADLPAEAQRMCDKWVNAGIIKNRDDYVKSYQWDKK